MVKLKISVGFQFWHSIRIVPENVFGYFVVSSTVRVPGKLLGYGPFAFIYFHNGKTSGSVTWYSTCGLFVMFMAQCIKSGKLVLGCMYTVFGYGVFL
jgi:hypothetical protein